MKKEISFLHAADLHLDSPFQGISHAPKEIFADLRESTFTALDNLVTLAIEKKVDFVLLVGDLFDATEQSLKAQIKLRSACEQLQAHHIHVYMSFGNHDYLRGQKHFIAYPENVFIFPDETIQTFFYPKEDEPLAAIYGFSYEGRTILENKAKDYTLSHPTIPFHIATLHGSVHEQYAPFLLSDLTEKPFDYWALGHIHKRQRLHESPPIVYPGNLQGRHHKEAGEKGCYYVKLGKNHHALTFKSLHAIRFETYQVQIADCETINDVEDKIVKQLERESDRTTPVLIQLEIIGQDQRHHHWEQQGYFHDLVAFLNEKYTLEQPWLYLYRTSVTIKQEEDVLKAIGNDHFFDELAKQFTDRSVEDVLAPFDRHTLGRKYVDQLSHQDKREIKEKAKQLIIHELMMKEDD